MNMYFNEPNKSNWRAIGILWAIILMMAIFSCTGKRGYEKYKRNNPVVFAEDCSKVFPPIIEYTSGTTDTIPGPIIFIKGDSIPCPDGTKVKQPDQQITCPPSTHKTDTVTKTDSALLYRLYKQIEGLRIDNNNKDTEIVSLRNENTDLKDENSKLKKDKVLMTIAGGMLIVSSALLLLKRLF